MRLINPCSAAWSVTGPSSHVWGGAVVTGETVARARALGLDVWAALEANDSYHFFDALGKAPPYRFYVYQRSRCQ